MADLGRKRKALDALEESTKRMRIETLSTSYDGQNKPCEEWQDDDSNCDSEEDSNDIKSQVADTPLTPFSPPRKFPSDFKTIKCTFEGCTKSFNRPARLASHLRSHTNERPFACNYSGCEKTYMEEKHLKQHIKGSHLHEKSYRCDWDGCNKGFLTATRLRRHQEAHKGHDRFRCTAYPPCNQTFRKHQTLQRHIRAEHLELSPFPCTHVDPITGAVCNAGFDSGGALRKHEDRFHGALRFWCDECSSEAGHIDPVSRQVGFRTKNELIKHIHTEHSNCIFCDTKCSSQVELQRHIEIQHSSSVALERSNEPTEPKTIACTFQECHKIFTKKYNLDIHVRSAHNGERFICSAFSTTTYNLKSPELSVWTGSNACGKGFVSKANLEDHIRTRHLGLPSLVNGKRLKVHSSTKVGEPPKKDDDIDIINLLTGAGYGKDQIRNIPCLIADCPWLFTRQYDLDLHLKSKHDLSSSEIEALTETRPFGSGPHDRNDVDALDSLYDEADLGWDNAQRRAADETAPFWIGAGDECNPEAADAWSREEVEMRQLIDPDGCFNRLVDPALLLNI